MNKRLIFVLLGLLGASKGYAAYTGGIGVNIGTMGKDITAGLTLHNVINNGYLLNIYGSFDLRGAGAEAWKATGAVGLGFGYLKSLITLKERFYWDKKKNKYFKSLGIGATFDLEQKFSEIRYIGGRYGATVWGRLNSSMLGVSVGVDQTKLLGLGFCGGR